MESEKEKVTGWSLEAWAGVIHTSPIDTAGADIRLAAREAVYIVETISSPEDSSPHLNQYFVVGLSGAVGMAAKLLGDLREAPEEIVAIREASPAERVTFEAVVEHFGDQLPPALTDDEALALTRRQP